MAFKKKSRTEEEQRIYDEKLERRSPVYIYHYCLNENLPKEHPYFCFNCWIDESPTSHTNSQQNWKFCSDCQSKYNLPNYTVKNGKDKGNKIYIDMVNLLELYKKATKEMVQRNGNKLLNGCTEADLELVFNKFYPNVKMVKGIYK